MTSTAALASGRYVVGRALGEHRFLGRDERLGRDVLLWILPVEDEQERARLTRLAAACARLDHPVFLQTLDLLDEGDRVVIVLESSGDAEQTAEHPLAGGLPALVAATLTLRIGTALEEAARGGLVAYSLPLTYVHVSGSDEVRLDPIGLFGGAEAGADGLVSLLTEFLASFLPGGERAGPNRARFDPGADAASGLVGRWRERAAHGSADDLNAFLEELRLIARAPAGYYVEADAGFKQSASIAAAVPPDEEVTVPLHFEAPPALPAPPASSPRGESGARPYAAPVTAAPAGGRQRPRGSGASTFLTVVGFGLIGAMGVVLILLGLRLADGEQSGGAVVETTSTAAASPTPAPADRATLSVTAQQEAQVRVSVDGAVAFTGVLQPNETRSWEGSSRVQVWTNNGKNLLVTVNGYSLGPLSSAVGHPDWNTVDWGWVPGWRP